MPHTTDGIIYRDSTYGVDVQGDIAKVLGRNTGDLGQLCKDVTASGTELNTINLMSRRKPTMYTGLDSDEPSQPMGGAISSEDVYYGYKACGIVKPYIYLWDSQYNSTGQPKWMSGVSAPTGVWTWQRPTKFRALDFDGYLPESGHQYDDTYTNSPYSVSASVVLEGTTALTIGVFVRYCWDDEQEGTYTLTKLLGLKSLFGVGGSSNEIRFGFMAYRPAASGSAPIAYVYLPNKIFGEYDSTTGSYNMISFDHTFTFGGDGEFAVGNAIRVYPVIARHRLVSGVGRWDLFPFAYKSLYVYNYTIPSTPSYQNINEITALSITYTLEKDSTNNEYTFYIKQNTDFAMTTAQIPIYNQRIRFGQPPMSINKADANSYTVSPGTMTIGTQDNTNWGGDWIFQNDNARQFGAEIINGYSDGATPKVRAGSCTLRPYTGVSSFQVGIAMSYYYHFKTKVSKNAYFTVPVTAQSGDTFTATFTF